MYKISFHRCRAVGDRCEWSTVTVEWGVCALSENTDYWPCTEFSADGCPERCYTDGGAGACVDPGEMASCDAYTIADACPTPGTEFEADRTVGDEPICRALSDLDCTANEFAVPPTLTTDRYCQQLSPPCLQFLEYESTIATPTTDRNCSTVTFCADRDAGGDDVGESDLDEVTDLYQMAPSTMTSDTACARVTACAQLQFEAAAPRWNQDRDCRDITPCGWHQYIIRDPTQTSDRLCGNGTTCTADQFEAYPMTECVTQGDGGWAINIYHGGMDPLLL